MASRQSNQSRSTQNKRSSNGRRASAKTEKYRFAQNLDGEGTAAEHEYRSYAVEAKQEGDEGPDVLLDVPVVKVDSIHLEVEDLEAQVSLQAKVLELLELDVGVNVYLGKLKVDITGVEAQALLKVRLDYVTAIVDRVMTTLDRNPELVKSIGKAVEQVGEGAGQALEGTGEAAEQVGEGANEAVGEIGEGAGQAVGEIGEGAGQAVGDVGEGAGQAVGDVGEGAGQAVGNLDETVGNVGQAAGQAVGGAGQAVGGAAEGVGDAAGGLGDAAGAAGLDVGELTDSAGNPTAPKLARAAAKTVAKEIGHAASDEAKEIGLAATRRVKEFGERRRQKRAERHHATPAALRLADELGVDLDELEGSGADGRIVIGDVREAAEEE